MTPEVEFFKTFVESALKELMLHRQIAFECGCKDETLNIFDDTIHLCQSLNEIAVEGALKVNYLNQFQGSIESILQYLNYRGQQDTKFLERVDKMGIRDSIDANADPISQFYDKLKFNLDFFKKIGFFTSNVVAIGANGSGKTSLSNKFKNYLHNNGVVISAQRILFVPNFDSISNPSTTATALRKTQLRDKSSRNDSEYSFLQQEFGVVLKNLLAENIATGNEYRRSSLELSKEKKVIPDPPITNLDRTLKIWNSLIEHRVIDCKDGMNITASTGEVTYPAVQMSDGEKVMLYLIGQVLQAPLDSIIIIDEPEMYLHKTILKKLWDILEKERQDCLFIYLTHDLDFATSRTTAKKIWIKSFTYPEKWDIEDIPENEIPDALLFELLGSRKNILFCEGEKGSIDERIYSILFPEFTITPVGGCFEVINHTKAFNKISNLSTKAFGLIDSDHHDKSRLESLKTDNIFSFNVTEPENLLLDENFLKTLQKQLMSDNDVFDLIKADIFKELERSKELQSANYVTVRINYYFKNSHVSRGNALDDVKQNYATFTNEVKIEEWYEERIAILEKIVGEENYQQAISIFNHKGLRSIVCKHLKIADFIERSIKLLQLNTDSHEFLHRYFPDQIIEAGRNK